MKKVTTLIAFMFVFIQLSFPQLNSIKDYPLKDYIAPDIKYRLLDLGTGIYSNGVQRTTENNPYSFSSNIDLDYYQYINTSAFQGASNIQLDSRYHFNKLVKNDTVKISNNYMRIDLIYGGQNLFYFSDKKFIGVSGFANFQSQPLDNQSGENGFSDQYYHINLTPYLSIGKGRIQPVQSARKAIDILHALQKCQRLGIFPDTFMIDSLARVANRIVYKRFYDNRFKEIYQLEQLDHAIQDMGLVDTADIVYFAHLNDIWNYAYDFNRGSGVRYEGGLIPLFNYTYGTTEIQQDGEDNSSQKTILDYGLYGFFSFNRMKPINYAWQSNLMIDLTLGINRREGSTKTNSEEDEIYEYDYTNLKSVLNASWQFGYFPNTRTFMGLTPYAAVSFTSDTDFSNDTFGFNAGILLSAYYYVSPRLRLSFSGRFYYNDQFDRTVPTPFWNSVTYADNDQNTLYNTDDITTWRIKSYNSLTEFSHSFSLVLRYAIF